MSCCTNGTDGKRDCPLIEDAWIKLFEILVINVKLRDEVESFSFFWWINDKMYRLISNYHKKFALRNPYEKKVLVKVLDPRLFLRISNSLSRKKY